MANLSTRLNWSRSRSRWRFLSRFLREAAVMYPGWPVPYGAYVPQPDRRFSARPFVAGSLIGFRTWGHHGEFEDGRLRGLFYNYFWRDGVNVADCGRRPVLRAGCMERHAGMSHSHDCWIVPECDGPSSSCTCGFWAYCNGGNEYYHTATTSSGTCDAHVAGIIEGFGKCVIGTRGFRCEKAIIRALVLPANLYVPSTYSSSSRILPHLVDEGAADLDDLVATERQQRMREQFAAVYPDVPIFETLEAAIEQFPLTNLEPPEEGESK